MTITATVPKKAYTASGGASFAYPFKISAATDLLVYYNGAQILVGFTVDGIGSVTGGNVTFAVTPPNGTKILLVRATTRSQGTDWTANDPDPAESKENAFDKAISIDQEQDEILARTPSYKVDGTFVTLPPTIDTPVVGQFVQFKDALGNLGAAVPALGTALSNPVSLGQGGTGIAAGSRAALLASLGIARWGNDATGTFDNWTVTAGVVQIPAPITNDISFVGVNINGIITSSTIAGTIIALYYNAGLTLTHSSQFFLLGATNATVVADTISIFLQTTGGWIEIQRFIIGSATNRIQFWRGDGTWQTIPVTPGIVGLILANNGVTPTTDVDVALGSTASDDADPLSKVSMYLSALITKRLSVNWVVGSGQGGLDTGAVADGTYHVFLIKRPDTGVVDSLFSLSATAPTMPANYTKKQRIGSILRSGGVIVPFVQFGDRFTRVTPILDVDNATPGTAANQITLSVPNGIRVVAIINFYTGNTGFVYVSPLDSVDQAPSTTVSPLGNIGDSGNNFVGPMEIITDTARQIRYRNGANIATRIATLGWLDPMRGKN